MRPYDSWKQVAAYFDGDGSFSITDLSNRPFKLGLQVIFTDQSPEQISMLREFFLRRRIKPSNLLRTSKGTAYMIAIGTFAGVLAASKGMLPYLFKKANEARGVVDYYESRITGNELVAVFRKEVAEQRRERRNHRVRIDVPYTFSEGDALMRGRRRLRIKNSIERNRAVVSKHDFDRIRRDYEGGTSLVKLVERYRIYSKETIRRILGRDRGYVLVKGLGRVRTANTTLKSAP